MAAATVSQAGSATAAALSSFSAAPVAESAKPIGSAQAAITSSNSSSSSAPLASTSSAAVVVPPPAPTPFRTFLASVVADGMSRCRSGWSQTSPVMEGCPKPLLAEWGNFLKRRKDGLKKALETAVEAIYHNRTRNIKLRQLNPNEAGDWAEPLEAFPNQKLLPNTIALREKAIKSALATILPPRILQLLKEYSQGFFSFSSSEQGSRPYNEDRMFARPDLRTWGVFDGHDGSETADQANQTFPKVFAEKLKETRGDVHLALQLTTYCVALSVVRNASGAVAAVAHLDEEFGLHLLTIGDSVIHIYRRIKDKTKCINVALLNDWSSNKERDRAEQAGADIIQTNPENPIPCNLVAPSEEAGVTNSRSLGDAHFQYFNKKPLVISKPAIAYYPFLQPDDIVLIMSDGYEFLPRARTRIAELVDREAPNLATAITAEAAPQENSDNVTAIAIHICG